MKNNPYALKYNISFDTNDGRGFTKEQIEKDGSGGADAIWLASIIREGEKAHDGSLSIAFMSSDGQNDKKPIPGTEMFTIWVLMASQLIDNPDIHEWQKHMIQHILNWIRAMKKSLRIRSDDPDI